MFNANKPSASDLPTTAQLLRSTLIALAAAVVILVTIVLPSEYAIDPTGVGRALGLTQMGEIKQQLAASSALAASQSAPSDVPTTEVTVAEAPAPAAPVKSDEVSFTLKPSEGTEYKLTMSEGAKASFTWSVAGGKVNYDLHATAPSGAETSYRKGREAQADSGELVAAFDGAHGWFWRNRGTQDVTITLRTSGDYSELKRVQ